MMKEKFCVQYLSQVWAYHPSRQSLTLGAHRIDELFWFDFCLVLLMVGSGGR